jgi:FixJ family two-component response regulator
MLSGGPWVMSDRNKLMTKGSSSGAQKSSLPLICKGATVLVVDDEPSVLSALTRLIRAAGFQVKAFNRPSALLANEVPTTNACMLVDVHLPETNGIELCKALAASGRRLAAILITGRNEAETQRLIEKSHPVAVLFKPVDERTLLEAVTQALALSNGDRGDD